MKNYGTFTFLRWIYSCLFACSLIPLSIANTITFTAPSYWSNGAGLRGSITITADGFTYQLVGKKTLPNVIAFRFVMPQGILPIGFALGVFDGSASGAVTGYPQFNVNLAREAYGPSGENWNFNDSGHNYFDWYYTPPTPHYDYTVTLHLKSLIQDVHFSVLENDQPIYVNTVSKGFAYQDFTITGNAPEGSTIAVVPEPSWAYQYDPMLVLSNNIVFDRIGDFNNPPKITAQTIIFRNYCSVVENLTINPIDTRISVPAASGNLPGETIHQIKSDALYTVTFSTPSPSCDISYTTAGTAESQTVLVILHPTNAASNLQNSTIANSSTFSGVSTPRVDGTGSSTTTLTKNPTSLDTNPDNLQQTNSNNNVSPVFDTSSKQNPDGPTIKDLEDEHTGTYTDRANSAINPIIQNLGGGTAQGAINKFSDSYLLPGVNPGVGPAAPGSGSAVDMSVTLPGVLSNITLDLNPLHNSYVSTFAAWVKLFITIIITFFLAQRILRIVNYASTCWIHTSKDPTSIASDIVVGGSILGTGSTVTLPIKFILSVVGRAVMLTLLLGAPATVLALLSVDFSGFTFTGQLSFLSAAVLNLFTPNSYLAKSFSILGEFFPLVYFISAFVYRIFVLGSTTVIAYCISIVTRLIPL